MKVKLDQLKLKKEASSIQNSIVIYTDMGIYYPEKAMGHKGIIAELPCCDIGNNDSCEYQIANLFISAPDLLTACKSVLKEVTYFETLDENTITLSGLTTDTLKTAISKAEGIKCEK